MELYSTEVKADLANRMKRIEGQVRGVQAMVAGERDCSEILQQLTAIQSAVRSASLMFVEEYASGCLLDSAGDDRERRVARDLVPVAPVVPEFVRLAREQRADRLAAVDAPDRLAEQFRQSVTQRMLGIAQIDVYTKDVTDPEVVLRGLSASRDVFDKLKDAAELARQQRVVGVVE